MASVDGTLSISSDDPCFGVFVFWVVSLFVLMDGSGYRACDR